jgi:hypothetical protein
MASYLDVWEFVATCQPGHTYNNPFTQNVNVPPGKVQRVRMRVPPGGHGEFQFNLSIAGQPVFPSNGFPYIVADDEVFDFYPPVALSAGSWQVVMVNGGNYQHSVYITFYLLVGDGGAPVRDTQVLDLTGATV